jgi:hypothetical protein
VSHVLKNDGQPQEDLAKSGYKTNREVENLGILYYMSVNHLNLLFKYGDSKEKKAKHLPKSLKNLGDFI